MKSKIFYTIILILWMSLIFWFSSQNGNESSNTSNMFVNKFISVCNNILNIEVSEDFIKNSSFIFRKLAHFTLYFILGIICFLTFKSYNLPNFIIIAILFTIIYAFTDEFHQMFISGRASQFLDILIDSVGGLTSIFIMCLFKK